MASSEEIAELGVSRSGRVRKKSSRLLEVEDENETNTNEDIQQADSSKTSKARRKSKADVPSVPTSPTMSQTSNPVLSTTPTVEETPSRKSRKRKMDSDSLPLETSEVEDCGLSTNKKSKKKTTEDLKIKLHLGASPHVEKVTSPTVPTTPKSSGKKNKKPVVQSSDQESPKEGTLKLKLLLSPNKPTAEPELEIISEPAPQEGKVSKKSEKKKKKTKKELAAEAEMAKNLTVDEMPGSPVEMSYEQFVEAIEEENNQKASAKKKKEKPEELPVPKVKKSKKSKQATNTIVEAPVHEDSWIDSEDSKHFLNQDDLDVSMETNDLEPDFGQDESSMSANDAAKAAQNFFQNKSGKMKKVKGEKTTKERKQRSRAPTAYTLWCNTYRVKVVAQNPGIDFAQTSKRLGEIWQSLPEKEKVSWRKKAKKQLTLTVSSKGSNLITTGKKMSGSKLLSTKNKDSSSTSKPAVAKPSVAPTNQVSTTQVIDTSPLNAAAHLKLLGESLSLIGSRLTEHRGHIAVQGSLSVLLDSMLCALGPLMTLCEQVPELTTENASEVNGRTLDHLAYIMPGL